MSEMSQDGFEAGDKHEQKVGYRQPPSSTRFKPGQSGNPKGRPRNRHRDIPYDAILGQMVTVREDGRERRITAAEAFILQLTQKGLAGDSAAARASLGAIEQARSKRVEETKSMVIIWQSVGLGIAGSLKILGIAHKSFPSDEKRVRYDLQPWIVEAALNRLGDRRLTTEEQREVWDNTRTPQKVKWPDWWTEKE